MRPTEPRFGSVRRLVRPFKTRFFRAMDAIYVGRLARFEDPRGRQLARILQRLKTDDPVPGSDTLIRVEEQRRQWLSCEEPLVDGTLGDGREWDTGASIREGCEASKDPRPAALLHLMVREFRPATILELGTNLGISCAYLSDALTASGGGGRLFTLEASPYRLRYARELHGRLGIENVEYREGLFVDTLDAALDEIGAVDMAFVDGHHKYRPTLDYFNQVCRRLAPASVVVFDDIRLTPEMRLAWAEITNDRRVEIVVDLYSIGVCVMADADRASPRLVLPPISYALQHRELSIREVGTHLRGLVRRSDGRTVRRATERT
jgi:predicted O-methyltransferase YrrM